MGNILQDINQFKDQSSKKIFLISFLTVSIFFFLAVPSVSAASVSYTYDSKGQRIKQVEVNGQTTKTTYYLSSFEITSERTGTNEVTTIKRYYPMGALRVIKYSGQNPASAENKLYYTYADQISSTKIMTDNQGNKVAGSDLDYYPYGTVKDTNIQTLKSLPTNHLYTNQINDINTGLYYYNQRYYDPTLGIFTSADKATGPNRYSYVNGNPIMRNDPSGQVAENGGGGSGGYQPYQAYLGLRKDFDMLKAYREGVNSYINYLDTNASSDSDWLSLASTKADYGSIGGGGLSGLWAESSVDRGMAESGLVQLGGMIGNSKFANKLFGAISSGLNKFWNEERGGSINSESQLGIIISFKDKYPDYDFKTVDNLPGKGGSSYNPTTRRYSVRFLEGMNAQDTYETGVHEIAHIERGHVDVVNHLDTPRAALYRERYNRFLSALRNSADTDYSRQELIERNKNRLSFFASKRECFDELEAEGGIFDDSIKNGLMPSQGTIDYYKSYLDITR